MISLPLKTQGNLREDIMFCTGRFLPLEGVGPEDIKCKELMERLKKGEGFGGDSGHQSHRRGGNDSPLSYRSDQSLWGSR